LSAWTHSRGNAYCDRIGRNISDYHGIGANHYVVADRDRPQDLGSWAYVNAAAYHGSTPLAGASQVDYDAMAHNYIIAEYGVRANNNAAEMLNLKPSAHACLARQVYSG